MTGWVPYHKLTRQQLLTLATALEDQRDRALNKVADAWDEAYRCGVEDERTSQANPGIAGCFCKTSTCSCFIVPARVNPHRNG